MIKINKNPIVCRVILLHGWPAGKFKEDNGPYQKNIDELSIEKGSLVRKSLVI